MSELLRLLVSVDPTGLLGTGLQSLQSLFGTPGLIAAMVLGLSIVALVVVKLLKIAFDVLRYVMVPSVVVAFIATLFLPYSFINILPTTVALFSVVLIIKA